MALYQQQRSNFGQIMGSLKPSLMISNPGGEVALTLSMVPTYFFDVRNVCQWLFGPHQHFQPISLNTIFGGNTAESVVQVNYPQQEVEVLK